MSCRYTDGNTKSGQVYWGPESSTQYFVSQCYKSTLNGKTTQCDGHGGMRKTTANDPSDFTRFYNEGFDKFLSANASGCEDGPSRSILKQCSGQPCIGGGGNGDDCDKKTE